LAVLTILPAGGQTGFIKDAWWTYQQDCNGDGCVAGTLAGERARLNWNPDVTNCNGLLTVFEIVYAKPCAASSWTALFTNAPHTIIGCRSSDAQYFDVRMGSNCACTDYKIELYEAGLTRPDDVRSGTNDSDLAQHREQLLAEDYCMSDNFAACAAVGGVYGTHYDNNSTATKEPGEPNHAGDAGGKSLWYCWTATNDLPVTFDTEGSTFDTLLAVYTGFSVSNLTLVASNDDIAGWSDRRSRVTFTPILGTTYHIAVDGFGRASGLVVLNWNQSGAALPDLIIWGPSVVPMFMTRTFATNDCEVLEGCAVPGTRKLLSFLTEVRNIGMGDLNLGYPATNSLFEYAACHGHYHFEEFVDYSLLDVSSNEVAGGHKVGFCIMDDHVWSPTANPQQRFNCDTNVLLAAQGIQAGWADNYEVGLPCQFIDITGVPPGNYTLKMVINPAGLIVESDTNNNTTLVPITIPPPGCPAPPNDDFVNALIITNSPFSFTEFNYCATAEPGEPYHAGDTNGPSHSVWFSWTPGSNQTAVLTTKRSDFDTLLAVYTGNAVSALSLVASNDDIINGVYKQSYLTFNALAGTPYRIAVDGYNQAVGTVVLNLNPPANDDFADGFVLSGATGSTNGNLLGASKEPGEPAHAGDVGGHSVWFDWTALADGPVDFNTLGSAFDTTLAVYTGDDVTALTEIASNNDDLGGLRTSRVEFLAVAGQTYHIVVDGFQGAIGQYTLNWNMFSQLDISGATNGQARVRFTGVDWQRYGLLVSSNLANWRTQAVRTMSGGSQEYLDTTSARQRFYRTVLVP
jgi:hypothetical protein